MDPSNLSPAWLAMVLALVLVELVWRVRSGRGYGRATALATFGLALGYLPFAALNAVLVGGLFGWAWSVVPVRLPIDDWRVWVAAFVAVEFVYYWFHRAHHCIRWMWASHGVHHSAEQLTLLSSLRLGWTSLLSAGWIFYLPLVFAGFDPGLVVGLLALNLRYQFFLHTEAAGRLGPLEWVLNTPAHHRVHHASNDCYLDRNYGGVLIVFDRLFGTFAAARADQPLCYGLAHRRPTRNPVRIAFEEWGLIARDVWRAPGSRAKLAAAFGPPGASR